MVDRLVVRYGALEAVRRLSFKADAGRVTAVLGPNGAGKTSTIEVLEGYRSAAGGAVRVLGLDPVGDHGALVRRMGVMLQAGGVYPTMRAGEAVTLFCAYHDHVRRPGELLELVGLTGRARTTWKQLSGGEQQRLSLALAIAGNPSVAFLDEPTAGVDVAGRQLVRAVVRELAASGCTVLLTTHELDEAERLADHVVIVDHGVLVASGSPDELRRSGPSSIRFAAPAGLATTDLSARLGLVVTEPTPGEYVVDGEGTPAVLARLTGWLAEQDVTIGDLRAGRQRLEDVFLRLTASTPAPDAGAPGRRGDAGASGRRGEAGAPAPGATAGVASSRRRRRGRSGR